MSNQIASPTNPFPAAAAQLSSPEAVAWYKSVALECLYCFCEGLVILMAGTLRAGQITRTVLDAWIDAQMGRGAATAPECVAIARATTASPVYSDIIDAEIVEDEPMLLPYLAGYLPAITPAGSQQRINTARSALRRMQKTTAVSCYQLGVALHGSAVIIPLAPPAPKRRRGGRKPKAA